MFNIIIIFSAKYLYILSIGIFILYGIKSIQYRKFISFSLFVLSLSYIFSRIAGFFYYNPRPFVSEHIVPLIHHIADNGFPSDHALLAGTIAAIVTVFDKRYGAILWILAIIIGVSRVLAGVHHTIDIIGSYIISLLGLGAGYIFMYYIIPMGNKRAQQKQNKK